MTDASQRGEVVVVPREPTEEMLDAADTPFHAVMKAMRDENRRAGRDPDSGYGSGPFSEAIWSAMLAASPPAPSGDSGAWEALEKIARLDTDMRADFSVGARQSEIARQALALRDAGGGSLPAVCAEDVAVIERVDDMADWMSRQLPGGESFVAASVAHEHANDLRRILSLLPGAGGVGPLWAMHVRGPDDVYAAPDYDTALAWCDEANKLVASVGSDVLFSAVPALWTGSAEEHAASFPEAIKGWTLPAAPTSEGSSALRPSDCVTSGDVDGGAGHD